MQKNKLVHEDIKAVCSSAAKKLVACGLVAATTVGGANFAALSYKNIACAQTGGNQQLYDATLSYDYLTLILTPITNRPNVPIKRIPNSREQLEKYRFAIEKERQEFSDYAPYIIKKYDTDELLLKCARCNVLYREFYYEEAKRYNLAELANKIKEGYTFIENGYRALAERVRANGGRVDEAIITELIELSVLDQNNHYNFTEALIAVRPQHESQNARMEAALQLAYGNNLELGLSVDAANANRERDRQRLMDNSTEIDAFEADVEEQIEARAIEIEIEIEFLENRIQELNAMQLAFSPFDPSRLGRKKIERLEIRLAELRARPSAFDPYDFLERENPERRTPNRPAQQNRETGGRQTITGNTMLQVQGTNYIEAWSGTHIHSLSNNALMHEGDSAVDVDRGDIIISDFSNGQTARDVTVNEANILTVAPDIATRIQNGTTFTIGRTAQETLENLQRDMGLVTAVGTTHADVDNT